MTVRLCVLLWARPGAAEALVAYEDEILSLLAEHGGRVRQRARPVGVADAPTEIQLIEFSSRAGHDSFLADERRAALTARRDAAIARTDVYPVELI